MCRMAVHGKLHWVYWMGIVGWISVVKGEVCQLCPRVSHCLSESGLPQGMYVRMRPCPNACHYGAMQAVI